MEIKEFKCWEDFEVEIGKIFAFENNLDRERISSVSSPLFRGQSDSSWKLKTTLDRVVENFNMSEYHLIMQSIKSKVESYTDRRWEIGRFKEPERNLWVAPTLEQYAFMVYLRHNKFPSPLLDWTRSPYIAAFFAFGDAHIGTSVAIFVYIEDLGQGKTTRGDSPAISTLGPDITTHKRHHLQQSEYSICTKKVNGKMCYWDHEEVFSKNDDEQDLLIKYILPSSEKTKVLKKLDLMNINAYSLFDTEESLMQTLTIREFFIERAGEC